MRALIKVHRWLGVAFCLVFAMWFASGIVMHFVPFPGLSEAERYAGLAPIGVAIPGNGPGAAVRASRIDDVVRVRLHALPDGAIYLVQGRSALSVLRAADLSPLAVSEALALAVATAHAQRRSQPSGAPRVMALERYDQWTVPNVYDAHRPLYRIAMNDDAGTELYVSSQTGEVVADTSGRERAWNYAGSVVHWIYPTVLRRNWAEWDATVWTLALAALVTALAGAVIGTLRVRVVNRRPASPYHGWHAWHHGLGLGCMAFVLTWIASGWLSMDHGRLFSTGKLSAAEMSALRGPAPDWNAADVDLTRAAGVTREIEWFVLGGRIYRRERSGLDAQKLFVVGARDAPERAFLAPGEAAAAMRRLSARCEDATIVSAVDAYPVASAVPQAPVYRALCGDVWHQLDGATGVALEKLDSSRRAYRWLYGALHTLDFPVLAARPALRTRVIVMLCALGFVFSVTGVVIALKRVLKRSGDAVMK